MLKIFVDAATKGNPGLSGAGIQLIGDHLYEQLSFPLPSMSNHEAEFAAFELALAETIRRGYHQQSTFIFTDSQAVAEVIDLDKTKNPIFFPYLQRIRPLLSQFPLIIVQWIPERENRGADNLARQGLQKALRQATD